LPLLCEIFTQSCLGPLVTSPCISYPFRIISLRPAHNWVPCPTDSNQRVALVRWPTHQMPLRIRHIDKSLASPRDTIFGGVSSRERRASRSGLPLVRVCATGHE